METSLDHRSFGLGVGRETVEPSAEIGLGLADAYLERGDQLVALPVEARRCLREPSHEPLHALAAHARETFRQHGLSFARGRRVELQLDEEQFTGGGAYLFASVLEHFLGLYASINSFSILSATTQQRKRGVREWPPRAGWKPLL